MLAKKGRILKVLLFTLLLVLATVPLLVSCGGAKPESTPASPTLQRGEPVSPTATPIIQPTKESVPKPKQPENTLTPDELLAAYSDGKYDYDFSLFGLLNTGDVPEELVRWIKPVAPALFNEKGEAIDIALVRGVGILCDKYVLTAWVPFGIASKAEESFRLGGIIIWGITQTAEGNILEKEDVKTVSSYTNPDNKITFSLLERSEQSKYPMPPPNTCPFVIGDYNELGPLHKLVGVGHNKSEGVTTKILLPWQQASVRSTDDTLQHIYFQGSVWLHDWGSPIFALRDGRPELVGLTMGAPLRNSHETKGFTLSINFILKNIEEKTGIKLHGLEASYKDNPDTEPQIDDLSKLRSEILMILAQSPGRYFKTLQYFDLTGEKIDDVELTQCTVELLGTVLNDEGKIFARIEGVGFTHGPYVFASSTLFPTLPKIGDPPPPKSPDMPNDIYEEIVKDWEKQLERISKFKYEAFLFWRSEERSEDTGQEFLDHILITDKTLKDELEQKGLVVFKRVPTLGADNKLKKYPPCNAVIGKPEDLQRLDLLVTTELTRTDSGLTISILNGSYMSSLDHLNGFYLQSSVLFSDLGVPVYALSKRTFQWELVGITTATADPVETRAFVLKINYVLGLIERIENAIKIEQPPK